MMKNHEIPDYLEPSKCAICGISDISASFKSRSIISEGREEFSFVECRRCGLVYLDPRPDPDFMTRLYSANICPGFKPREKMTRTLIRREKIMRRVEVNSKRAKVREICRLKDLTPDSRVLDVGSLTGSFLRAVQIERKCRVQGVDISETAADYVKRTYDIPVEHIDFLDYQGDNDPFDCITMWHMLEHAYDPGTMLDRARVLLKNDGLLVIEVPNLANWYWRFLEGDWIGHFTPSHLYGFAPYTLKQLLRNHGFEPVEINSCVHFPLFSISLLAKHLTFINARFLQNHPFFTLSVLLADLPIAAISRFNGKGGAILAYAKKS